MKAAASGAVADGAEKVEQAAERVHADAAASRIDGAGRDLDAIRNSAMRLERGLEPGLALSVRRLLELQDVGWTQDAGVPAEGDADATGGSNAMGTSKSWNSFSM